VLTHTKYIASVTTDIMATVILIAKVIVNISLIDYKICSFTDVLSVCVIWKEHPSNLYTASALCNLLLRNNKMASVFFLNEHC